MDLQDRVDNGQEIIRYRRPLWIIDCAERTKAALLDAAAIEFAGKGYASARVEDIAQRVGLTKRLFFYCFESKEKLYIAALESAYQLIRTQEAALGGLSLASTIVIANWVESAQAVIAVMSLAFFGQGTVGVCSYVFLPGDVRRIDITE